MIRGLGQGCKRGGIGHNRINDAVAARHQRLIQQAIAVANQEQRGLVQRRHRGFSLRNVGVLPITGQNMPFLGLNARSDVLFTTGALTFFLIAAMRLHREAVGTAAIRNKIDG